MAYVIAEPLYWDERRLVCRCLSGGLNRLGRVCARFGPVTAIFPLDDLPEKWRHYAEIDASYVVGGKFQADKFKK